MISLKEISKDIGIRHWMLVNRLENLGIVTMFNNKYHLLSFNDFEEHIKIINNEIFISEYLKSLII